MGTFTLNANELLKEALYAFNEIVRTKIRGSSNIKDTYELASMISKYLNDDPEKLLPQSSLYGVERNFMVVDNSDGRVLGHGLTLVEAEVLLCRSCDEDGCDPYLAIAE